MTAHQSFRGAYFELEGDVRDLRRAARLALLQLHRANEAFGRAENEEFELAILTVDDLFRRAAELEQLYDRNFRQALC